MKRLLFVISLVFLRLLVFGQTIETHRKITVSGVAEQEITPDIMNVSILLQEYKDGKNKITMEQLESQLQAAVKTADIPAEDITVNDVFAFKNELGRRKKNTDILESKQFIVKLHTLGKLNQVIDRLDPQGIQSTEIASYDYSKMTEAKRNLKIQALLAAKEKATYLLNSIGEKLGQVIEINEADNNFIGFQYPTANTTFYEKSYGNSDTEFKKIKLTFQVNAVFEIVK